jgi:arylsulfatase A-like enzyme
MARQIVRKDPTRPAFWYLSFSQPHPPMTPLRDYLQMYRGKPVPEPTIGQWMQGDPKKLQQSLPTALQRELQRQLNRNRNYSPDQIADIHRAFYASCTHIDHQLRVVLGTLRQHGQLDNTILCFTADHGDMLGHHRLWAKHWMYERSANVPMILVGTAAQMQDGTVGHHRVDDRLVGLADVMPTLLELAGVPVPDHVEGRSMLGQRREHLFGVWGAGPTGEGGASTRMIHDGRFKLVYYPVGNLRQLFDLQTDPEETKDLAGDADHAERLETLSGLLAAELARHESDARWVHDGELVGDSTIGFAEPGANRGLSGQRGTAWPIPPITGGPR